MQMRTWIEDFRLRLRSLQSAWRRARTSLRTRGLAPTLRRIRLRLTEQVIRRQPQRRLFQLPHTPFAPFKVPRSEAPTASVIIPVYGQVDMTVDCLRALAAHPPGVPIEIIVVDDGSKDETPQSMRAIDGLRYHLRARNGGFIAACNDGASIAAGEFLVFLNNDTIPQPGWLDALLETFAAFPDTGLAGAQLIYPDGRLQEAGGVVFSDGSAWNYGKFASPEDPRFNYMREADYCSGAAIAIRRQFFASLGGFDTRYAPACYEDIDLAFAVRQAGLKTRYQPASRVVQREGVTSGTDTGSAIKAHQVRNAKIFAAKWQHALATQLPNRIEPSPAALHRHQKQVLIIDTLTPCPDRDSGSLRLVNLMKVLQEEGAHVCFVPLDLGYLAGYTEALQALGIEVWHSPWITRLPAFLKQHGPRFDTILLCRHYTAHQLLPLARQHAPRAKLIFDTVDLHYLRELRGARMRRDTALERQALATRKVELAAMHAADLTLVVSPMEQQELSREAPGVRVQVLSNLHQIEHQHVPFSDRHGLLFVGGFHHPPNVDAMRWFIDAILPLIHARAPGITLDIVGMDPPEEIKRSGNRAGVRVHGHVPDLNPLLRQARVSVAPLRFGAGVKGKVNQAMAHGLPVVATATAVEGMHLQHGIDVLVAEDPQAFADAVLRLHADQDCWDRLASHGLENVRRHFSLDAARAVVREAILQPG
jgi:GT2 family glycosyltransferase/glycosyltransferase involved in cell wall biosynthesis